MKAVALFSLAAALTGLAQNAPHSPDAEFNLNPKIDLRHLGRGVRSYLGANPMGLTLVTIGENSVSLVFSDLDGRVLHSKTDLASVHAQIYAAVPRPDGCVWLASAGPYNLFNSGAGNAYNNFDLYSAAGDHLMSVTLLIPAGYFERPIAAGQDRLVLRSAPFRSAESEFIHFGAVSDGHFNEQVRIRIVPPVSRAIPVLASNGDLIFVGKETGSMMIIDPNTKGSSIVRFENPRPVQFAAVDSDYLYLLSASTILKTDVAGHVRSTYHLELGRGFKPAAIGVTGASLYLVDRAGRAERFHLTPR